MKKLPQQKIPDYVIENIARMMLPEIQKFYETDEGKAYFEEWKSEHNGDENKSKSG